MREKLYLCIGVIICGSIIAAWYFITNRIEKNIRYLLIGVIAIINIFEIINLKQWNLLGIFWLVSSGAFYLSEKFPKSPTAFENNKKRRERVNFWEDYLFVVGVVMIGIGEWLRVLIASIEYVSEKI